MVCEPASLAGRRFDACGRRLHFRYNHRTALRVDDEERTTHALRIIEGKCVADETDEQRAARLERERREITDAVFQLMQGWAAIENGLTVLLAGAIGPMNDRPGVGEDIPLASAIIFSLAGLDARITVAKNSIVMFAQRMPRSETIIRIAESVFGKLSKKRTVRNQVMHGALAKIGDGTTVHTRMCPPGFDMLHVNFCDPSKHGLSGNDLRLAAQSLGRFEKALHDLVELIRCWRRKDMTTYEQILQRLEAQFPPPQLPAQT